MPSGWKDIARLVVAQGSGALFSVVTLIVTAHVLGPEGRGIAAAALALSMLTATIASVSLGHVLVRHAQLHDDVHDASVFTGTLVGAALGLGAIAALILLGLHAGGIATVAVLPMSITVVCTVLLPLLIWEQYGNGVFALMNRIGTWSRLLFYARLLTVVIAVVAIGVLRVGPIGGLLASVCGQLWLFASSLVVLRRHAPMAPFNLTRLGQLVRPGIRFHATVVASIVLDTAATLIVNRLATSGEAGRYQLAQQLVTLMLVVPQAAAAVLVGRIGRDDPDLAWERQRVLCAQAATATVALAAVAAMLAPLVVPWIAGNAFAESARLFVWMLPSLLGLGLATLLASQWIARGLFMLNGVVTISIAIVLVVLTPWAVRAHGAYGAAWVRALTLGGLAGIAQLVFVAWLESRRRARLRQSSG